MDDMNMLNLDGSQGEGGGQILRSALTLSTITGTPFRIERIRGGRAKPGLLRQHLTAVTAAAAVSGAQVSGNAPGSQTLEFVPGAIRGGDYRFDIGTAGSCTLVLQTVLPALWFADGPSTITVSGGTHNGAAPPADFLIRSWLPLMRRMGVEMDIELERHGFYPAGGGRVRASVTPCGSLLPLHLEERGEHIATRAVAVVAGLPAEIAGRELDHLAATFSEAECETRVLSSREGPGNVVMVEISHASHTEVFTGFGEKGLPAKTVAARTAHAAASWLASGAAVGEHLADQLLLPMALAKGGAFTTALLSSHTRTNIGVIEKFLPLEFDVAQEDGIHRVSLTRE